MSTSTVVILSSGEDVHARSVQHSLQELGASGVLVDLAEYPQRLRISQSLSGGQNRWTLEWMGNVLDAEQVAGVWYRRPSVPVLPHYGYTEEMRELARRQVEAGVQGWLSTCENIINRPSAEHTANRKGLQLHLAQAQGIAIPDTCITNDPACARDFWEEQKGNVIFKGLAPHPRFFHETRLLRAEDLPKLDALLAGPAIFQSYVPLGRDLRITIVDQSVVATEVVSTDPEAERDWRLDGNADYKETDLSPGLSRRLLQLLRRLGLRYGAIDVREAPDGVPYFLEVNPGGQFLFNDIHAGTDISGLMAAALLRRSRPVSLEGKSRADKPQRQESLLAKGLSGTDLA
jgi:hypothetical protein